MEEISDEVREEEQRVMAYYLQRQKEEARAIVFKNLADTCQRSFPTSDKLQCGLRLAVMEPGQPVRVLVEVVESEGELYFQILSSRHPEIKCQPADPLSILAKNIYAGIRTKKMGRMRFLFWELLCQFKNQKRKE